MKFDSKYKHYKHKKTIHDKSHQCEVCLRFFEYKSSLVVHKRTHTGEKPFVCSTCGKGFATKYKLQLHKATHSDERKFKCDVCPDDRSFKTKGQLALHMVFHYEKKHSCPKCKTKFYFSTRMKNHMKNCGKPTYFSCGKCGRKFDALEDLKKHEKINISKLFCTNNL